jgi:hypothetical protein
MLQKRPVKFRRVESSGPRYKRASGKTPEALSCVPCSITTLEAGVCSRAQGVRRETESEGRKANVQAEAQANQRWPSTSTTRHENGEVSYETFGPSALRGSVQKGIGDVGGDYGRHEWEVCDMTTGDLITV